MNVCPSDAPAPQGRLAYLTLQRTVPGQASRTHVWAVVEELRDRGWEVEVIQPAASRTRAGRLLAALACQRRFARRLRGSEVVYVRLHPLAAPAVRLARRRGLRVVGELNGPADDVVTAYPSLRPVVPLLRIAMRQVLRALDVLVVVTPQLGRWARELEPRAPEPVVVPNAADPERFRPRAGPRRPRVVYAGALHAWQGIPDLLDAVAHPDWPAEVELVVLGDGPLAGRVRDAATRERVRFRGPVPQSEVAEELAGALAAVSPKTSASAHGEVGQSAIKVYEALAAGVPVVATDVPGQREPVRESGGGWVVPEGRPDEIVACVRRLHEEPETWARLGEAGRAWVTAGQTWRARVEQLERVLTDDAART